MPVPVSMISTCGPMSWSISFQLFLPVPYPLPSSLGSISMDNLVWKEEPEMFALDLGCEGQTRAWACGSGQRSPAEDKPRLCTWILRGVSQLPVPI